MQCDTDMGCSRCGNCCQDVDRTFWKTIILDKELLCRLDDELLTKLNNGDHEDGNLPCEMLAWRKDSEGEDAEAACRLEILTGVKPSACRDHQGDGRCVKLNKESSNDS